MPTATRITLQPKPRTAYVLQGQALEAIILDIFNAPGLSQATLWIAFYVLLSRAPSLDRIVFLSLPTRRGALRDELQRLDAREHTTLQNLRADLLRWGTEPVTHILDPLLYQVSSC